MSAADTRVVVAHIPPRRRRWSKDQPPYMRIVLLGKSVSENSGVGNFLLGRAAFDSEAPPDVVERVGGRLKDRHVMIINSPQLLQTNISDDQITQTVRECVNLSDPGPHMIVLLLKHDQCSAEDQECVGKVLKSFSERVYQHTMVLTTQEPTKTNDILQKIIQKCCNRHFSLQRSSSLDDLLQMFEDIVQMNDGRHLDCAEASQYFTMEQQATERLSEGVKLNLVVCGSDGTLKSSVSEQILKDVELHGHQISLVDLPALFNTRLSEEEVMRQTLRCVSLCDPGVHVFLLIIPDAPFNNEDKAKMEKIQKIFSSRINKHTMILIMQSSEHQTAELNEETQSVIEGFGGRHHFFGPNTQVSTLMENIEKMLEENRGEFFSTETFLEAQMKKLMKYEEMKKKIHSLETLLLSQGSAESKDELRIVLLGKTGVGKSATGNTILGRNTFKAQASFESVTKESQRETSEINGRLITVIDTPGLFDTELSNEEIQREIRHCISMILPGPHVFIIVLNLGQRFTQEEATSVKIIQETFGEKSLMYTMVLFTRGDDLKDQTIEQCLGKPGSPLMNLIEACGNRFHVFNNNQTGDRTQVSDLLEKIDNMVTANGRSFYSCKMFREMEREKQEQQMKILMDRVREKEEEMNKHKEEMRQEQETLTNKIEQLKQEKDKVKTEKEKLQIKYDTEIERLMNRIENERKKREEQFTEREEQYKKLMKEKEDLIKKHEEEKERMKMMMEKEQQNDDKERKRREDEFKREITEQMKHQREIQDEMRRERETFKHEIEEMKKEKENLKITYNTEIDRLMNRIENERQNQGTERKRREEEFNEREEQYKREMKEKEESEEKMREEMKREREEWEKQKLEEKMRREEEDEKRREKEQRDCDEFNQRLKQERERMKREKEDLQSKHEEEKNKMKILMEKLNREREEMMKKNEEEKERMKMMMEEERQNHDEERKRREELKREIREQEEHQREIRDEMRRERETFKHEIEEMRQEKENMKKEKDTLKIKYETERDRLMNRIEDERQNHDKEKKRREKESIERERYEKEMKEKDELMKKQEEEIERIKTRIEEERQNHDEERKRREDEFREREERYKTIIKDREERENELIEQMKLERMQWEKQKQEEGQKREQEKKKQEEEQKSELHKKQQSPVSDQRKSFGMKMEGTNAMCLNLVLLGKTRTGKSASGNTILGREAFKSKISFSSVTQHVAVESGTVGQLSVTVYDTPGFCDIDIREEEIQRKYKEVLQKCESGPCVFLLVIKADRFTEEERKTVEKIEKLLGEKRLKKTWILFTRGDELEEENTTINEFLDETEPLKKLVQKYDQRYHVFNNKKKGHTEQVQSLFLKILKPYFDIQGEAEILKQNLLMRKTPKDIEPDAPAVSLSSRRIVLLGKTGVGKSAAGNTILGQKEFNPVMRMTSVTRKFSEAHTTVSGRSVSVVDTPGFFDTTMNPKELMTEMARSVYLSSPGPHAFLIVFPVNISFTEQEQQVPQLIEMVFGQEVLKYSIILFTHGDHLDGESVEELIEDNSRLRRLVDQCGGRFHVFNNRDQNNREQVNDLLQKIDTMIEQNGGEYYSNQMFEDALRFRREEEEQRQRKEQRQEERKQQNCVCS